MKKLLVLKKLTTLCIVITALTACNVNNGLIQKRKYRKGYHVTIRNKVANKANTTTPVKEELALNEEPRSQTTKEDKVDIIYSNLLSKDTIVNPIDKSIAVNNSKALKTNKVEKEEKLKTANTLEKKWTSTLVKRATYNPIIKSNTANKTKKTNGKGAMIVFAILLIIYVSILLISGGIPGINWLLIVIILIALSYIILTALDVPYGAIFSWIAEGILLLLGF
ncbi:hypothetical protein OAN33_01615 [Flavobacteriales bacterium]|nr:hypothetical protein [Flavobacteriales bacterium]